MDNPVKEMRDDYESVIITTIECKVDHNDTTEFMTSLICYDSRLKIWDYPFAIDSLAGAA